MISFTQEEAMKHLCNFGKIVAYKTNESKTFFMAKYRLGDRWSLGAVEGIIVKIIYFEEAEPQYGHVIFEIKANISLEIENEISRNE